MVLTLLPLTQAENSVGLPETEGVVEWTPPGGATFSNSTGSVNNSLYWDGNPYNASKYGLWWKDGIILKPDTANDNVDLGTGGFAGRNITLGDFEILQMREISTLPSGAIAGMFLGDGASAFSVGDLIIQARAGSARDIIFATYDGTSNDERWRIEAVGNLEAQNNENISATYFKGDGSELTGINSYWNRTGTTISPSTAGDNITTTGVLTAGAGVIAEGQSVFGNDAVYSANDVVYIKGQSNTNPSDSSIHPALRLQGGNTAVACFLAGTKVDDFNIEDIKVGDKVKSFNEETGEIELSIVKNVMESVSDHYYIINGKIKTTAEHPFYVDGEWVKVKDLEVGMVLFSEEGDVLVESIKYVDEEVTVYNIEVEGNHNYFVYGVLVHNKSPYTYGLISTTGSGDTSRSALFEGDVYFEGVGGGIGHVIFNNTFIDMLGTRQLSFKDSGGTIKGVVYYDGTDFVMGGFGSTDFRLSTASRVYTEGNADFEMESDYGKFTQGLGRDVSLLFDGSDWIFNAEVGTPNVNWTGFSSYYFDANITSSDQICDSTGCIGSGGGGINGTNINVTSITVEETFEASSDSNYTYWNKQYDIGTCFNKTHIVWGETITGRCG